jgi:tetratricopeptide (TPR) repeat protein
MGMMHARAGYYAKSEPDLRAAIERRKPLLAEFPHDRGLVLKQASCLGNLGVVLANLNRRDEAKDSDREAIHWYRQLVERPSPSARELNAAAVNYNNLAWALRKDGEIDEARRNYALAVEHELKAFQIAPTNAKIALFLKQDYQGLGDMALVQKDHAAAADAASKLAKVRPDNAADAELAARFFGRCVTLAEQDTQLSEDERRALAKSYADSSIEHLREAVRRGHKDAAALRSHAALAPLRARPDFQQLVQEVEAMAGELFILAVQLRRDGQVADARQHYEQSAELHLKSLQAEPTNSGYRFCLREDYHGVGDMALLQKDHAAAADAADKLAQVRPDNPADAELAARFFCRCVRLAEKDLQLADDERVELAQAYADRAMEHLREAVRRGYKDAAALMRREALVPLRERPDFLKLVAELKARPAQP